MASPQFQQVIHPVHLSTEAVIPFAADIVTGLTHHALGKDVLVRETKCVAMGDPFCEFVAEPKSAKG